MFTVTYAPVNTSHLSLITASLSLIFGQKEVYITSPKSTREFGRELIVYPLRKGHRSLFGPSYAVHSCFWAYSATRASRLRRKDEKLCFVKHRLRKCYFTFAIEPQPIY